MALIECPECDHEVSDQAAACPKCARPLQATAVTPTTPAPASHPTTPTTIEATSKKWKGLQLKTALICIVGIIIIIGAQGSIEGSIFGAVITFIGLAGFIYARIGAWWKHG